MKQKRTMTDGNSQGQNSVHNGHLRSNGNLVAHGRHSVSLRPNSKVEAFFKADNFL